jgi:hypothetical protein
VGPRIVVILYHFDLYPRDDPRDGARVVRFTKLQSAEYRGEANGTGAGEFTIRADVAEAQLIDPRGLQYVRVVREDTVAATELVVGGFFLDSGDFSMLDEQGTRLLKFGGAGTLSYLARSIMASHTYISPIFTGQDPFDDTWRLYAQSTVYANGNFLGAMLWRVIYEAQHNTPGTHRHADGVNVSDTHADDRPAIAIPDLVMTFDQFEDTNGNDWAVSSGEFKAQIGENVLGVVKRLMEAGLYVEMDPDTFELNAYPASTHRRNRTGGAWGTNVDRRDDRDRQHQVRRQACHHGLRQAVMAAGRWGGRVRRRHRHHGHPVGGLLPRRRQRSRRCGQRRVGPDQCSERRRGHPETARQARHHPDHRLLQAVRARPAG